MQQKNDKTERQGCGIERLMNAEPGFGDFAVPGMTFPQSDVDVIRGEVPIKCIQRDQKMPENLTILHFINPYCKFFHLPFHTKMDVGQAVGVILSTDKY